MANRSEDILSQAKIHLQEANDAYRDIYANYLSNMRFVYDKDGGQWEGVERGKGRVKITDNKLLKWIRQAVSDQRINKPRLKVIPVDDFADVEKAKIFNGLLRQIEYLSSADIAYATAYASSIAGGIGYWRIVSEWENEFSLKQELRIKEIDNPCTVLYDPHARDFNKKDAMYCFIYEDMKTDAFKKAYPGAISSDVDSNTGQSKAWWFQKDKIRVAEYFYKEEEKKRIALVNLTDPETGETLQETVLLEDAKRLKEAGASVNIVMERDTKFQKIMWCKLSGAEVIEGPQLWHGKYIPIIPVQGDKVVIDGKVYLLSLIDGAISPQRMLNYWITSATEQVALQPRHPTNVLDEQIKGYETEWAETHIENLPYRRYRRVPGAKEPYREMPAQLSPGMAALMQQQAFNIEDHLGKYASSKGAPSNERSGVAIDARIRQSEKGNVVFIDNMTRALIYSNQQIIDLIPHIYNVEQALQIYGEEGEVEQVRINIPTPEGVVNDLTIGKYDLIATLGPATSSRRQETSQAIRDAMQYAPTIAPFIAPLLFKYLDVEGAEEIQAAIDKGTRQIEQQEQQKGDIV